MSNTPQIHEMQTNKCSHCNTLDENDRVPLCTTCGLNFGEFIHKSCLTSHLVLELQQRNIDDKKYCAACGMLINYVRVKDTYESMCTFDGNSAWICFQEHITICFLAILMAMQREVVTAVKCFDKHIWKAENMIETLDFHIAASVRLHVANIRRQLAIALVGTQSNFNYALKLITHVINHLDYGDKLALKYDDHYMKSIMWTSMNQHEQAIDYFRQHVFKHDSYVREMDKMVIINIERKFADVIMRSPTNLEFALEIISHVIDNTNYDGDWSRRLDDYYVKTKLLLDLCKYEQTVQAAQEAVKHDLAEVNMDIILKIAQILECQVHALNALEAVSKSETESQKLWQMCKMIYGNYSEEAIEYQVKHAIARVNNGHVDTGIQSMLEGMHILRMQSMIHELKSNLSLKVLKVLLKHERWDEVDLLLEHILNNYDVRDNNIEQSTHQKALHFFRVRISVLDMLGNKKKAAENHLRFAEVCSVIWGKWAVETLKELDAVLEYDLEIDDQIPFLERVGIFLTDCATDLEASDIIPDKFFVDVYEKYCEEIRVIIYLGRGGNLTMNDLWEARKNTLNACKRCYGNMDAKTTEMELDFSKFCEFTMEMENLFG